MSNEVKTDIQRSGEQAERVGLRAGRETMKQLNQLLESLKLVWNKHFSDPITSVKNSGRTADLCYSDRLTESEARELLAKLHNAQILTCFKEVNLERDEQSAYNGKTISQQENFAKNNIKYSIWKNREDRFENVPFLHNICEIQKNKYADKIEKEKKNDSNKQYIFFVNKDDRDTMGRFIEEIRNNRLLTRAEEDRNILPSQNEENVIEKGMEYTHDLEINSIDELNDFNKEYGLNECSSYRMENVCTHVIPKEVFMKHSKELFETCVFGAKVRNEDEMLLVYTPAHVPSISKALGEDYAKYKSNIIEYGGIGSLSLQNPKVNNDVVTVSLNEKDLDHFKELYKEEAYLIEHNSDGTYTVISTKSAQKKALEREALKKQEANEDISTKDHLDKELDSEHVQTNEKFISSLLAENQDMNLDTETIDDINLDEKDI